MVLKRKRRSRRTRGYRKRYRSSGYVARAGVRAARRARRRARIGRYARTRRTRTRFLVPRSLTPSSVIMKFTYRAEANLSIGVAQLQVGRTFRANSCQDPEQTTIGVQPYLWDQYALYYNSAKIIGSKMTARWVPDQANNEFPARFRIELMDAETHAAIAAMSTADLMGIVYQLPIKKTKLNNCGFIYSNRHDRPSVTMRYSPRKFWGNKIEWGVQDFVPTTSGSASIPISECFFELRVVQNSSGALATYNYHFDVYISYLVLFNELKTIHLAS